MMKQTDLFLLLDVVQFTRRDWRNRNRIKTSNGLAWVTVPVVTKGMYHARIDEMLVEDRQFYRRHLNMIRHSYRQSPYWDDVYPWFSDLLTEASSFRHLSQLNSFLLRKIADYLGIDTPIVSCVDILPRQTLIDMDKNERLLALCQAVGAREYLSGPAAQDYLSLEQFQGQRIEVEWMRYGHYPPYPQLWGEFTHRVSIIDVLFNNGPGSRNLLGNH